MDQLFKTLAVLVGTIVVTFWQYNIHWLRIKNTSGFPFPPGPKGEPFLGHFETIPLVKPELSYINGAGYSVRIQYHEVCKGLTIYNYSL